MRHFVASKKQMILDNFKKGGEYSFYHKERRTYSNETFFSE